MTTNTDAAAPDEFSALIADLDLMQKAMNSDAAIAAAAKEGEGDPEEEPDDGEGEGTDGKPAKAVKPGMDPAGAVLGKSFEVVLPDGSKDEVFDATDLLKSLMADRDALQGRVAEHDTKMASALAALQGAVGALKQQGSLVKALQADVAKLGNVGTGRRATLSVHDRPSAAAAAPAADAGGVKPRDLMAKAMELQKAGELSAIDISRLEMRLERGQTPDAGMVSRIMGVA